MNIFFFVVFFTHFGEKKYLKSINSVKKLNNSYNYKTSLHHRATAYNTPDCT